MVIAICKHHTFNMNRAESILFSKELLSDFIDQYLSGDIEKICSFDFDEVPQASRFGKPKDYKEDWLMDPDDSLIMRSILFLIYYPEIPDLTLDLIGNVYRGDTLFTLGNILGRNDEFWERQELNPKDDADFFNMVDSFKSAYHTLPNIILLPNKKIEVMRERNQKKEVSFESLNNYRGLNLPGFADYVDTFLLELKKVSQKDKCGEDKYLEKLFFENSFYFDLYENRFDDFVRSHFLECLYKKNNPNNELKDEYIFKHYVWWQKSSGYKEEVVKFLKGFENMQKYRGEKVINKLKGAFSMDEKARLMMMASYDLREDWHNELGTWDHDICNQLSKKNIYRSCWLFYTYKKMTDKRELDASNGKYQLMMDIYNTLWGHYQGKLDGIPDSKGYSDGFRYNYIFDKGLLFGGDTMHSIMNSTNFTEKDIKAEDFSYFCTLFPTFENLESIIHASGCIGNYILVPAYFNSQRPGKDNWLCAISYLSKNNWDIATKAREKSQNKLKNDLELEKQAKKTWKTYEHTKHFSKYINGMFLWDYVSVDEKDKNKASRYFVEKKLDIKTDQEEICRLIYRRGVFMAAMLCIAGIDKNVYSEIQKNVFAVDETYNGYSAVISKINEIIGNKELVGGIKTYVTALKKCLCETDIRDSIKK